MNLTVELLPIPETLGSPGGADFIEMAAVRNTIEVDTTGIRSMAPTAADLLPNWQDQYDPKLMHVARLDGRIVGRATISLQPEADYATVEVEVLPEVRRRGIGAALWDAALATVVSAGRTSVQSYVMASVVDGERVDSPTGFGSVPVADPGTRFAIVRGFALGQVIRGSLVSLPAEVGDLLDRTQTRSGDDYRVVRWVDFTPEEHLDDVATLHSRMSTDAPAGELDVAEEVWDAERVRSTDALRATADSTTLVTAALHVPTGQLVAFSELSVPKQPDLAVHQWDTLVLREHRGHRLGMLVKLANLAFLDELHPGHPEVVTFNAEENRPMLDVNERIGFRPFVYEGVWKLAL